MGTTFFSDIKRDRIHLSVGNCHKKKPQQNLCNKIQLPASIKITPHKHFSVEEMKAREIIKGRDRFVGENDKEQRKLQFRSC